jgi:hypothetical protein
MAEVTKEQKIAAAKKSLEEAQKVTNDTQTQYTKAEALYNKAKAATLAVQALTTSTDAGIGVALSALSPEEKNVEIKKYKDQAKKLEKKAQKELEKAQKAYEGAKKRILIIQEQLQIIFTKKTPKEKAEQQKLLSNQKIKNGNKKIKIDKAKLKAGLKKVIAVGGPIAIVFVFGRILNSYITRLAETVNQLSALVDQTNNIISAATTKTDIQKAGVARDAALATLSAAEAQVRSFEQVIQSMSLSINIFTLIINIAAALPTAPYQLATIGIIASRIIAKFNPVLISLSVLLQIAKTTLDSFLTSIAYERSRLLPLNEVLDQAISQDLTPEETRELLANSTANTGLGPVMGADGNLVEHNGFTFSIIEENDPKFVVAGNKRRYAVALDRSGFVVLQSTPSFTLDPNVLIEELKVEIDKRNLKA